MQNHRTIIVSCAGLMPNELSALKSVFTLSRVASRTCHFELAANGAAAEIVVLAGAEVAQAAPALALPTTRGVLWVGEGASAGRALPREVLRRPLLASRLLSALDRLVETIANTARTPTPPPATPVFHPAVLVVDDSPTVRRQVELVLAGMEAQVELAVSAESALEAVRRRPFDLVLLDVVLPGADGYSICRAIKRDAKTRLTPVVMLTSKSSPFDKIRGTLAGCDNYLTKPVTKDELERTVSPYLQALASASQPCLSLHPA